MGTRVGVYMGTHGYRGGVQGIFKTDSTADGEQDRTSVISFKCSKLTLKMIDSFIGSVEFEVCGISFQDLRTKIIIMDKACNID